MAINPLEIPCAYCGKNDVKFIGIDLDSMTHIYCLPCDLMIPQGDWVNGSINALAGILMRNGIYLENVTYSESDVWIMSSVEKPIGIKSASFEEAVLDAYQFLKLKKGQK